MASDKDIDVDAFDGESPKRQITNDDAFLADPVEQGLSLYEKKAVLVNRELDSHGMGKYQWYIFFLCGFGYLIDLLYAQAFGLIEPAIQQEFGFAGIRFASLHHRRLIYLQCNRQGIWKHLLVLFSRTHSRSTRSFNTDVKSDG